VIRIPIIEGENQIADLNTDIGYLDISSSEITRDIPAGSEVEVTIEIDQYLNIRATAYMPILNMDFETEFELKIKPRDMENLLKKVTEGKENIRKIKEYIDENDLSLLNQVWQLEKQINISQIEQQLKSPAIDLDTKLKTEHDVSELMASIDKLKTSFLKDRANAALEEMDYYLNRISNPTAQKEKQRLQMEFQRLLEVRDYIAAEKIIGDMNQLNVKLYWTLPEAPYEVFEYYEHNADILTDYQHGQQLIQEGQRAITNDDRDRLIQIINQLYRLLPKSERSSVHSTQFFTESESNKGFGSTVIR